jgi:hypothetical protein
MIMDRPANTFTSYFGNTVTVVDDSAQFSFDFTLDPGAVVTGWQFVVDGSKYDLGTAQTPGGFVENFYGGYVSYDNGGALPGNLGSGYPVPDSGATLTLLGCALVGIGALRRKFRV